MMIKGAAGSYTKDTLTLLTSWGGNTIRTYDLAGLQGTLNLAKDCGIKVIVGLGLNAKKTSDADIEAALETVRKHKDNPTVLMWAVGNEIEVCKDLEKTFRAVQKTALQVKKIDPSRRVTNVFVDFGSSTDAPIREYLKKAEAYLDWFGFNTYTGGPTLAERYFLKKPFWVGELGWMPAFLGRSVTWNPEVTHEKSSTDKAAHYKLSLENLKKNSLFKGALVFRWDYATPYPSDTWHCCFIPSSLEKTQVGDVLIKEWTGKSPATKAPSIISTTIYDYPGMSGKVYTEKLWTGIACVPQSCHVEPGDILSPKILCEPGQGMQYTWRVQKHNITDKSKWPPCTEGGDCPTTFWNDWGPTPKKTSTYTTKNSEIHFTAPPPGEYRLHVTIVDSLTKNAAYASWPFRTV